MAFSVEIFCCYARKDQALLNELKEHLSPLQRQGLITIWADTDIDAGLEWKKEIEKHLNTAQIILLLISPAFMASDYCYGDEMKKAIERHERKEARVIPIILRHIYWQDVLGMLQALPTNAKPVMSKDWHNPDEAFDNVAQGIRKVVKEISEESISQPPMAEQQTLDVATFGQGKQQVTTTPRVPSTGKGSVVEKVQGGGDEVEKIIGKGEDVEKVQEDSKEIIASEAHQNSSTQVYSRVNVDADTGNMKVDITSKLINYYRRTEEDSTGLVTLLRNPIAQQNVFAFALIRQLLLAVKPEGNTKTYRELMNELKGRKLAELNEKFLTATIDTLEHLYNPHLSSGLSHVREMRKISMP